MYLSRVAVDRLNRNWLRALAVPEFLHAAIENCVGGERQRNLWRIDTIGKQDYLLIVSQKPADFSPLKMQFGKKDNQEIEPSVCYDALFSRLKEGQVWRFKLCANPTKSIANEKGKRGKVKAIAPREKEEWLISRAPSHGFSVNSGDFMITEEKWKIFKKGKDHHTVSLYMVTYEGVLEITDVDLLCHALTHGIGRGKAYGCGMLTIAK